MPVARGRAAFRANALIESGVSSVRLALRLWPRTSVMGVR